MNYRKPEITEIGDAARLIQGSKPQKPDAGSTTDTGTAADSELDD